MNIPNTVTYSLEEFLVRFEQRIDKQFAEVNQKMDKQFAEVNQKMDKQFAEVNQKMDKQFAEVNQKMDKQFAEVNQKLNKLEVNQVELSTKVSGIDKRLDNQEFINRSVLVAVILALVGAAARFFGLLPIS